MPLLELLQAGPLSPGILADGTLYVSGQTGEDEKTHQIPSNFEAGDEKLSLQREINPTGQWNGLQRRQSPVQVYLTDLSLFPRMNAVYTTFFPDPRPARTTVGVTKLTAPGCSHRDHRHGTQVMAVDLPCRDISGPIEQTALGGDAIEPRCRCSLKTAFSETSVEPLIKNGLGANLGASAAGCSVGLKLSSQETTEVEKIARRSRIAGRWTLRQAETPSRKQESALWAI